MVVFDLLSLQEPRITPLNTKVHLAGWNGEEDPVRVYLEGRFDEWQSWQTRRNIERPHVVALLQLPERDRWLYAGTYATRGSDWHEDKNSHRYRLEPMASCSEFAGRLVVNLARPGRQPYLNGDGLSPGMSVHEIRAARLQIEEFPGFKKVDLGFPELEVVVRQNTTSWRTALSNVAGIYLISEPEAGKLYVGSATGEGGIWGRWCQYVDGHGNNVIAAQGDNRARRRAGQVVPVLDPRDRRRARKCPRGACP